MTGQSVSKTSDGVSPPSTLDDERHHAEDVNAVNSAAAEDPSSSNPSKYIGVGARDCSDQVDDEDDDQEDDDEGEEEDDEDDDEEPRLKYARLTSNIAPVYRNGDATSIFLVSGDKMIIGTHSGIVVWSFPCPRPLSCNPVRLQPSERHH